MFNSVSEVLLFVPHAYSLYTGKANQVVALHVAPCSAQACKQCQFSHLILHKKKNDLILQNVEYFFHVSFELPLMHNFPQDHGRLSVTNLTY